MPAPHTTPGRTVARALTRSLVKGAAGATLAVVAVSVLSIIIGGIR